MYSRVRFRYWISVGLIYFSLLDFTFVFLVTPSIHCYFIFILRFYFLLILQVSFFTRSPLRLIQFVVYSNTKEFLYFSSFSLTHWHFTEFCSFPRDIPSINLHFRYCIYWLHICLGHAFSSAKCRLYIFISFKNFLC